MNKKLILGIIVLIIAGGIGGFFYFTSKEQGTKGEQGTIGKDQITNNNEQLPEGIEVVVEGGTKKIIDNKNQYEFTLPSDLLLNFDKNQISIYKEKDQMVPSFTVQVLENPKQLNIDLWLSKYNDDNLLMYYDERQKINSGNVIGYKIKEEGDPAVYSFYFAKDDKIYVFSAPETESIDNIVKTFNTF